MKKFSIKTTLIISMIVFILSFGTTFALNVWTSSNTLVNGNTKCFKIDYTKGQDINFTDGLVAQSTFNKDEAVSTTLTISRNKDCDICGTGTIFANITSSIDLSAGGLNYKIYKDSGELKTGSITKAGVNILYENFDIFSEASQFTIYFYLDANKINNNYLQTSFTGKIYAEAKSTKYLCSTSIPTLVNKVTDLYTNATKTSVTTAGGEAITQAKDVGLEQDSFGNIRYYGADPNNYVTFNGEESGWRIIGIFDTEDENGNISKRIKLIRTSIIGSYGYDSKISGIGSSTTANGSNNWADARLMMTLNPGYENKSLLYNYEASLYWNRKSGNCYAGENQATLSCDFTSKGLTDNSKSQIDKVKYYLGGNSSQSGLYADDYYKFERGTKVYSGHQTTWIGYIGLMYPSDYAYATDLSVCTQTGINYNTDTTNCKNNDWLLGKQTNIWTLSPGNSNNYTAFAINTSGSIFRTSYYVYGNYGVNPVLYLNQNIKIVKGAGSKTDPFILG